MKWAFLSLVLLGGIGAYIFTQQPDRLKGFFAMHHGAEHKGHSNHDDHSQHANHGKASALSTVLSEANMADIGQGDWHLETTTNAAFTPQSLRQHYRPSLVFFGFSHCPDICPPTLQNIALVEKRLPPTERSRLNTFFVTIDPARDTKEQLVNYLEGFSTQFVGVRGEKEALKPLLDAFKAYGHAHHKNDASGGADHSSLVYLMDDKGQLVKHFSHNVSANVLMAAVRKVM